MPVVEATSYSDDGKPSTTASSAEDGKEGTNVIPDSKAGTHVYYRLYTKDGPLESHNPIYSKDRFISRISSRSVRPPHTAASMKNYLRKIEGFNAADNCALYLSLSEQTPLADSTRLSIRGTSGPGSSNLNPMALVVDTCAVEKRSKAASAVDPPELLEWDHEQRYVYYLVYDEDGEVLSKTSFGENSPFLGRINALSIPPPHTVASLKQHLIKCEEILGHSVQLFEDEGGESTMDDSDAIALVSDTFPGFLEHQPIAIAYESQGFGTTTSEDQYGTGGSTNPVSGEDPTQIQARELHEAPSELAEIKEAFLKSHEAYIHELAQLRDELGGMKERELGGKISALDRLKEDLEKIHEAAFKEGASPNQLRMLSEDPSLTHKLKVTNHDDHRDPLCLSVKTGDILYSNGRSPTGVGGYRSDHHYYFAINASGFYGYVDQNATILSGFKSFT